MVSKTQTGPSLTRRRDLWVAEFAAMASPCEVHLTDVNESEAGKLASLAFDETRRIEQKYSRYRDDNIVWEINNSHGRSIEVDTETAALFRFADQCYQLSEGMFDITSGVLRRAWKFDGREIEPDQELIKSLLTKVGWDKARWDGKTLALQPDMEIDLGGLGKEYAVDRVAGLLSQNSKVPIMVNFGGDVRVAGANEMSRAWTIGIESPSQENQALGQIDIREGGVATSGDAQRYCLHRGVRMGHILNPLTGWPVAGAPRSVTVVGGNCLEAGFLSTLAMLQGDGAEAFLSRQGVQNYCSR